MTKQKQKKIKFDPDTWVLLHCSNCHHEYHGVEDNTLCEWCGSTGYDIEREGYKEYWKSIKKAVKNGD